MSKNRKSDKKSAVLKVTRMDVSEMHAGGMRFESDVFYARLANRLYEKIDAVVRAQPGMSASVTKRAALMLTGYVEDLVASTGVWHAFTSLHQKKYGRKLPFYNLDNPAIAIPYDDELPSLRAVQFMLWYVLNEANPDTVLNPLNPAICLLAMDLLPMLIDAYEEAPASPSRPKILPEEEIGTPLFFQLRNLCNWLCTRCYLTRINDMKAVTGDFSDFMTQMMQQIGAGNKGEVKYSIDSFVPLNAKIGPLGITAQEWLAEMVELYHEDDEAKYIPLIKGLKSIPYAYYKYTAVNGDTAKVIDMDGNEMVMSAMTMPDEKFADNIKPGCMSLMSLVCYDGSWVMNSLCAQPLAGDEFDEMSAQWHKKNDESESAYKYLLKAMKGKPIGVCRSYEEYLDKVYGKNKPQQDKADIPEDIRTADNLLYFLNSDAKVSMLPGWGGCVKLRGNKFYDKEEAADDGISLIFDHSLSTPEFREYIIENNLIPDAAMSSVISPEAGRKLLQENMRFFNDYASRETMTYVKAWV